MRVGFGVLGPVTAWDGTGEELALRGPRHRAVLARLILARRRVVPVDLLVDDLWEGAPPPGAISAVRTFVAALRRALEPDRPPRTPATLLTTRGPGYALDAAPDTVDSWLFEQRLQHAAALPPEQALPRLQQALDPWRGPAYADFPEAPWARTERARLAELRLGALEHLARTRLDLGLAARTVPDLDAHVAEHPWREDAWRLLALALYRTGRQGDALGVLRRARSLLVEQLGVDPGPALRRLEQDILRQAAHLDPDTFAEPRPRGTTGTPPLGPPSHGPGSSRPADEGDDLGDQLWNRAADAYRRTVTPGARVRLESTVSLLRDLAVTGPEGLLTARAQRLAAVTAAEELGDPLLTARVIGTYDVPANWTRVDDPERSARVVAAAERTLAALPDTGHEGARARLSATVALESRGTRGARGPEAASEAERLARDLGDPTLLAFALNARYMQTFHRTGLAPERDALGSELIALATRHDLVTFRILGHLIRVQSLSALADWSGADHHDRAALELGERHERPLTVVFSRWYRALRAAADHRVTSESALSALRDASAGLRGAGMPGLEHGLEPLALLCLRLRRGLPAPTGTDVDYGPHEPWARPHVLLARHRTDEAASALSSLPEPPRDLLLEARWALAARAAMALGDRALMRRALTELTPAVAEEAGAQTGILTLGPVADHLDALRRALGT
ncbi:BTAD domain-containing putative transcriptional regulator [Nocardiopsis sp. SBT366]|uniref:BTAD domain-containing putative transcriptional regulator n=1 Tax=Nocardiopsis sp. SBT366 TaxID=1580529 RepID=UPI00066DA70F|nr:BTAD domain-containing putative transcriptional regulator [Nocardiopsis sp. SBT366]